MKQHISLIFCLVLIGVMSGCGNGDSKRSSKLGAIENGVYKNSFFGFTMDIPEDLSVMSRQKMDDVSADMSSMLDAETYADKDDKSSRLLLVISLNPILSGEQGVGYNYNIAVASEWLDKSLQIKNTDQYVASVLKSITAWSYSQGASVADISREMLGGNEFSRLRSEILLEEQAVPISQDIYVRVENGYALSFTCSYVGEGQKEVISGLLASVKFH